MQERPHSSPYSISSAVQELVIYSFHVAVITYVGFLLLDNFASGYVSPYLNLNVMLVAVLATGVLSAFITLHNNGKLLMRRQSFWTRYAQPAVVSAISGYYVWFKVRSIGTVGIWIAILSVLMLFFVYLWFSDGWKKAETPKKTTPTQ